VKRRQFPSAFTLIEVLVVVVVLGVLASMVIAQFMNITVDAHQTTFINNGRAFADAIRRFQFENGYYPVAAPNTIPAGLEDYLDNHSFLGGTPIGGVWNISEDAWGVQSAIGVFFPPPIAQDEAYMLEIDAKIDDGDLSTGIFRKGSEAHYFFVVRE
jgi:prepilin-type N-terminal cleavage/methylation domain-containing protein